MNQNKFLGYLAALGYACIIGFSFIFVKDILTATDPLNLLTVRFFIAFLFLLLLYPFYKNSVNLNPEKIKKLMIAGIFYPLTFFTFQAFALNVSTSIEVGAVQATAPIITLILASIFLKEKTNFLQKSSVIICVLGVLYIMIMKFIKNAAPDFTGILIAFIGTIGFSIYTVYSRPLNKICSNYEMLLVIVGETFFLLLIATLCKNIYHGTFSSLLIPLSTKDFIIAVLYLAFLSTIASGFLINFALKNISSSQMVVFNNLGTVIQILAGVIILGETLFPSHIIGSILIISGILGVNLLGNTDNIINYIPKFYLISGILSLFAGVFTFFMGVQNMSSAYINFNNLEYIDKTIIDLINISNNYATNFYIITLIFIVFAMGLFILYYHSKKEQYYKLSCK